MLKVNLVDRISVPTNRKMTDSGQMHVPCKFARTGTQLYTAGQLGLKDADPNKIIEVHRTENHVFDEESMSTFRSAPVTIGHPKDEAGIPIQLTAENSKDLQVGMLEGMPVRDEDTLGGVLVLTAQEAIDALEDGTQELSAGYTCDISVEDGKYYQSNIRANHIAIVDKGRAGSSCRISDEAILVADEDVLTKAGVEVKTEKSKELVDAEEVIVAKDKELVDIKEELATKQTLVDELRQAVEEADVKLEAMKVEVADAKEAAKQDVAERCKAMENARLISDMRDLEDKTVEQIERMVVEDQMPEKDLEGKSEAYVSAMFDILVDASKGETPMGKLLKKSSISDNKEPEKKVDKVKEARERSIARSKDQSK